MPKRWLLFAALVLPGTLSAQGSAERGQELAANLCAQCHDISPAGEFKTYPPSFASIAVFRDVEQIFSRIMFPQLHSAMPQAGWFMPREDVEDLVAFIVSLEPTGD